MMLMRLASSTLTQKLKLTPKELPKTKTINDADEARKLDLDSELMIEDAYHEQPWAGCGRERVEEGRQ